MNLDPGFSDGAEPESVAAADRRGFVFSVAGELYGVDLDEVEGAVGVSEIVPLPWTPPHVLGVMRIRGAFEPIVSLARILGLEETEAQGDSDDNPRVLLLRSGDLRAGLRVERIEDVTESNDLSPCPAGTRGQVAVYARGVSTWRDRFVCWLSAERILNGTRLAD